MNAIKMHGRNENRPMKGRSSMRGAFCGLLANVFACLTVLVAQAAEISPDQSRVAVCSWMEKYASIARGKTVREIETISDPATGAKIHVAHLNGGGFVVTSADDRILPVMAYSENGTFVNDPENPLWSLLCADASVAQAALPTSRNVTKSANVTVAPQLTDEEKEWDDLLGRGSSTTLLGVRRGTNEKAKNLTGANSVAVLHETRVKPMLKTEWGQTTHNGQPDEEFGGTGRRCFNYYTPIATSMVVKVPAGTADEDEEVRTLNCPCGCVATAAAQVMRWHSPFLADGNYVPESLNRLSDQDRMSIGLLTAQIGSYCNAKYSPKSTSMAIANLIPVMRKHYDYAAFYRLLDKSAVANGTFDRCVIPNLIARMPVILGISGTGGHAVVADGLRYEGKTRRIHLNLGWYGRYDAWYTPPVVKAGDHNFTVIDELGMNITLDGYCGGDVPCPSGSRRRYNKAIVAGHVSCNSNSLKGVTVKLLKRNSFAFEYRSEVKTDGHGQFCFFIDGSDTYTLAFEKDGFKSETNENVTVSCSASGTNYNVENWYGEILLKNDVGKVKKPSIVVTPYWTFFKQVDFACATEGASIYYTVDGSIPTEDDRLVGRLHSFYDVPAGTGTLTLRARAFKDGMEQSDVESVMIEFESSRGNTLFVNPLSLRPSGGSGTAKKSASKTFNSIAKVEVDDDADFPESGSVRIDNSEAEKEPGEPVHSSVGTPGGASVWVAFTAPEDGDWTFSACGADDSSLDTQLAVYTGDALDALTLVAANDNVNEAEYDYTSKVAFSAKEGVTYRIAIDTRYGEKGVIRLDWKKGREDTVSPETSSLEFGRDAKECSVKIRSTAPWKVLDKPEWCTIVNGTGEDGDSLTFTCSAIEGDSARRGMIVLAAGEEGPGSTIRIVQEDLTFYDSPIEAQSAALAQGKALFVLSGGDWCSWCGVVKRYLKSLGTEFTSRFILYYNRLDRNLRSIEGYDMPAAGSPTYAVFDPRLFDYSKGFNDYNARLAYNGAGGFAEKVQEVLDDGWESWQERNFAPVEVKVDGGAGTSFAVHYAMKATFSDGTVAYMTNGVTWSIVSGTAATVSETGVLTPVIGCSGEVSVRGSVMLWGRAYTQTKTVYVFDTSAVAELTVSGPQLIDLYDEAGGRYAATVTCRDGTTVEVEPEWSVSGDNVNYAQMSWLGELGFSRNYGMVSQCATVTVAAVYGGFSNSTQTVIYGPGHVVINKMDVPQNAIWPGCTFTVTPKTIRWWRHGVLEAPTNDLLDVAFSWSLRCPGDEYRFGDGTSFTVPSDAFSTDGTCTVIVYSRPDRERYYSSQDWRLYPQFCASRPQMVTMTFDANGGEASFTTLNCVAGKPYGYGFLPALTRKGYYGSWYTAREGGTYVNAASNAPTVNATLYAHWNPNYYDIKYDANGGEGEMYDQGLYYDSPATLRERTFKKDGFSFAGWALSPDGPVAYEDRQEVLNLCDDRYGTVTLYAVWRDLGIRSPITGPRVSGPELIDLYDEASGRYTATVTCQDGTTVEVEPEWSVSGDNVNYVQMSRQGELSFYNDTYTVYQCATATITAVYAGVTNSTQTVIYGPGYVMIDKMDVQQNAIWPGCTFTVTPKSVRWWRHGVLEEPTSDLSDVTFGWVLRCPGDEYRSGDGTSFTVPPDAFSTNGTCTVGISTWPNRERYYEDRTWWLRPQFCASRPQMVTVTFDANDGEASFDTMKYVAGQPYGNGFLPELTRRGYSGYWYTARDGGIVVDVKTNAPTANTTLYAHWSPVPYWLTFDANGGEGEMYDQYLRYDSPATLNECTFKKGGCSFAGWALAPDGPVVYEDQEEVLNLRDERGVTTLYAIWRDLGITSPITGLRVSGPELIDLYDEASGRYTATVTCQDGTTVEVEPEWSVSGDNVNYAQMSRQGKLSFYYDTYTVYQCATATITAVYAGVTNSTQTVIYGPGYVVIDKMDVQQNAIWPGCTFAVTPKSVRWWRHGVLEEPTSDLSDVVFSWDLRCPGDEYRSGDGISFTVPSDAFSTNGTCTLRISARPDRERYYTSQDWWLYPQFSASRPQMVIVTFDANDGETSFDTMKYVAGKPYGYGFLPMLTRRGYYGFWYSAREGGTEVSYADAAPMANTTLYAHWYPIRYSFTFDANGGEGEMYDQYLYYDTPAAISACAFRKEGSSFVGWALSPDGPVVYEDQEEVLNLRDKLDVLTLYAVWQQNGYVTITFDANGGTGGWSRSMSYGAAITAPEVTYEGYEFKGWVPVPAATVPASNVTYTARWTRSAEPGEEDPPIGGDELVEQTITIQRAGWNLVSINVLPDAPSPEAVFADVADSIQSVISGTRRWTPQSGGRLAALQIGVGYWVKTTRDNVVWTIRGKPDEGVEIHVNQGWNLIGYPLLEGGSPEVVLQSASNSGIVSSVISGTRRWTPQTGGRLAEMTPGVGYWLKATKAGTIKFDR